MTGAWIAKAVAYIAYAWLDYTVPPLPVILDAVVDTCTCPTDPTPCDDGDALSEDREP